MTLQFPASPSLNQTFTASNNLIYKWDGEKWITLGSSATDTTKFVRNDIDNTYAGLISATGSEAFGVPVGTTAEQPANADGLLRYNSTLDRYEGSSNGSWGALPVYQQGLWTPSCELGTLEYANVNTVWSRVGNLVTLTSQLYSFTSTSADTINIIDLPYNAPSAAVAGSCFYQFGKAGYSTVYVSDSNTFAGGIIQLYNTSASAWDAFKYSNSTGNFTLYVQATYLTDDTTFVPINGATVS